jgi:glutathione S-transferase
MLRIVDAPRCPYCARVRMALAEKQVEYEAVVVDLADRPAWVYELNASGRVPILQDGDYVLPESAVINELLEERFPDPPLLPADPGERAIARMRIFRHDDFSRPYYALRRGDEGAGDGVDAAFGSLDAILAVDGYLTGRSFGLADIAYLPWVIRARDTLGVSLEPYPRVAAWLDGLSDRPSVAAEVAVVAAL